MIYISCATVTGDGDKKKGPLCINSVLNCSRPGDIYNWQKTVLESLWLEALSEALHSRIKTIKEPRSDRLRAAGMFDISLGDIGRSSLASEAVG